MREVLYLLVTMSISFNCLAVESNYSSNFEKCMESADGITLQIRTCYADEFQRQDSRLNKNYSDYISVLPYEIKRNFIDAQRKWIRYRDANCSAFESEEQGGTLALIVSDDCLLKMTIDRADEFENKQKVKK